MTTKTTGRWVNKPNTDKLVKLIGKGRLEVGLLDTAPDYPDGTPILEVANYNEFGGAAGNPPPRHWLRKAAGADKKYHSEKLKELLKYDNVNVRQTLFNALGKESADRIKKHIETNDIGLRSNAESTKAAKGGDSPMIESTHLVRSIDYRITRE